MAEFEEKVFWKSKTEWVALVGAVCGLANSFGWITFTTEHIGYITTIGFALIMVIRTIGGGKIVIKKS